jgi:cellulose 1,4-beta-cellobiosidase
VRLCDEDGCNFNRWRLGAKNFYGPGLTVETKSPFVVTQFVGLPIVECNSVQNGKVIKNSMSNIPGIGPVNSLTDEFCQQQKKAFKDTNDFNN